MAFTMQEMKVMLIVILCYSIHGDAEQIGVNYGMNGDNLPSAGEVVTLMKNNSIGKMRIFQADHEALQAFENSSIDVIVGVGNTELQAVASNQDSANGWVNDNIVPFYPATNIKYIAVGNEVLVDNAQYASYLVSAMNNIQTAIESANLQNIKVSTPHATTVIGTAFPPSQGTFSDSVKDTMNSVLQFLDAHGSPFMANVYPYFSYTGNEGTISLDYALFRSTSPVVTDGDLSYTYLFDAMVDTLLSAMGSLGHGSLPIVITESGWPSAGGDAATVENAQTYNNNLIKHVLSSAGTPKRPGTSIETYIFALFNENLKTGDEIEKHFGLFNPNQQPVYPVNFSP
uniref:TSA: Wollemia nobilis Ref_Wollemi_Transcript_13084_1284 transcribed RNA sequence n=1 Tax=Wollemia nobilis TaxID=56998 RepID=A0A0C9RKW9_9CONI